MKAFVESKVDHIPRSNDVFGLCWLFFLFFLYSLCIEDTTDPLNAKLKSEVRRR